MMEIDKAQIFGAISSKKQNWSNLRSSWPAEDYHQDYYKKSKVRYNYYRYASGRDQYLDKIFGDDRKDNPKTLRQIIDSKNAIANAKHT